MENRLFCKGYTWGWCSKSGEFQTLNAERSMERLASDGVNWICIAINVWQETFASTRIFSLFGKTQTDEDIIFAIKKAKSLGMKVCLKPIVNCLDKVWRARIDFPNENQEYWDKWFFSYTNFMSHYATLAEKYKCEMLCTGCEMAGMDKQSERCIKLISEIRKIYNGLIMHNINHGDELKFDWLSQVDIIGISAYYPVTDELHNDIDTMRKNWKTHLNILKECHDHYNKPIMFAEIGVRNEHGCTMHPWDFIHRDEIPFDEQEQSDFYQSAMEATWCEDWFCGYFWWDWKATLPSIEEAKKDRDFTVYGKKAEAILKSWYTKQ